MSKDSKHLITRRGFVRGTVGTAVAASVLGPSALLAAQESQTTSAARSTVALVRDQAVLDTKHKVDEAVLETMLDSTIMRVTGASSAQDGWASLIRPDDVVGLVITDFMNPTHPELVSVVAKALARVGVARENVRDVQGGDQKVRDCTALLCMPAMKAHWLTGVGTVIKNYIMFSGKPSAYHKADSAKLGEIWQMDHVAGKTRLVLVDALRPMCNKGPQVDPRFKWDYAGLIAGVDPVAVETTCLRIIEAKRSEVRGEPWPLSPPPVCIEAADKTYGLGNSDPAWIDVDAIGWQDDLLI
jgi:hypothetical protein